MLSKTFSLPTTPLGVVLPAPIPLTKSASSWIIHVPKFFPPPTRQDFHTIFESHPKEKHPLCMFGKQVFENRYSQLFVRQSPDVGESYRYSGTSRPCIACDPTKPDQQFVLDLCQLADQIVSQLMDKKLVTPKTKPPSQTEDSSSASASASSASASASASALSSSFYNCCLVNWYQPEHSIGLHSDDESEMDSEVPILSLSWGGPRRFLLRPKPKILETNNNQANSKVHELLLQSGDLVIMGGKCQEEFKHEVPKLRKMDGLVDNRISWTIRRMKKKSDDRKRKR